jgi:1-deoxy-D-xylulose-5-phosphate synthase
MSSTPILDKVNNPQDLKALTPAELEQLAQDIRQFIIQVVAKNGGHLAPNLGVVELSIALYKTFDMPKDKLIWDVGHQSYIHKILSGRKDIFPTLRLYKGMSGFPKRVESEYDVFGTGHSSTSLSAAMGIASARDIKGEDYNVIAVIGDGSMTGGMSFEALNHIGDLHKRLIVILNDNEMSISKNVGAMSKYFTQLRTGEFYTKMKGDVEGWLKELEHGDEVLTAIDRVKKSIKYLMMPGSVFEHMGFKYFGPVDGHDLPGLLEVLTSVKVEKGPVLIHVITKKGKGYKPAEDNPNKFHGTGPFDIATGKKIVDPKAPPTYTDVFSKTLLQLAAKDKSIVAITAAMPDGTGLSSFAQTYPKRFFDVGIAEQHAVTFAAGLATQGLKPVAAIYSTFLQRAYDQVLHDVCLQKLPVKLCLDRAGLVGDDGPTHHGTFDMAFLREMPNMVIMAPSNENELQHMLATSMAYNDGPIALRYPRGAAVGVPMDKELQTLPIGKAKVLAEGKDIVLWAIGTMVQTALEVAKILAQNGISAGVVDMRFAKPIDAELLLDQAKTCKCFATLEEGILTGGVGTGILEILNKNNLLASTKVYNFGLPDAFVPQGNKKFILPDLGLDAQSIAAKLTTAIKG